MMQTEPQTSEPLSPSAEIEDQSLDLVADTIGQLMEFWGFKRVLGRLWAVLFLSQRPLHAQDLAERLGLSAGAVNMGLHDLLDWGAIHRVSLRDSRKDYYQAEGNIWKLISRVLSERELHRLQSAMENMETAKRNLKTVKEGHEIPAEDQDELAFQIKRLEELSRLGKLGRRMLELLLLQAKVDVRPFKRFYEGKSQQAEMPPPAVGET